MKFIFLLSMIVCNACYGQTSILRTNPTADIKTSYYDSGQEYRHYFDSLRKSNDKRMFAHGYIKAIDSFKINFSNRPLEINESVREKYNLCDSTWINSDTTRIVFRYYKKLKKTKRDRELERHFSNY